MKLDFSKEAINRLLANILVVIVGISFYFALLHLETIHNFTTAVLDILRPFVYGFVIAFLLNNPVKYFDQIMKPADKERKMRRAHVGYIGYGDFFCFYRLADCIFGAAVD